MDFVCGSAAACAAVTLTNPLEVIRTLFQLRHELQSGPSCSAFNLPQYVRREGITCLQRGLSAALPYQFVMNGIRLSCYDRLTRLGGDDHDWHYSVVAAAVSGGTGAFFASPFNLIKTRLQSKTASLPKGDCGYQHNYRSLWDGLVTVVRKDGGFMGLWRGAGTSVVRTAVGSGVQLSSYDLIKRHSNIGNNHYSMIPSVTASLLTVLFMNPFDVVMTRMYNQSGAVYKNILDCFAKIVRTEGVRGLYKGFLVNYVRLGPHTILTLTFYDYFKAHYQ